MTCVTRGRRSALSGCCVSRQHKVPRFALTLPHQEGTRTSFFHQQLLGLLARQVLMVPPGPGWWGLGWGAQVRLGAMAWPGEGTQTHMQPEGSKTRHRHRETNGPPDLNSPGSTLTQASLSLPCPTL